MNSTDLGLQAVEIKLAQLILTISDSERRKEETSRNRDLPEWITLDHAARLKGGAAFATYETKYWLQPCCGLESKRVGGRKAWKKDAVIEWLGISDDKLPEYASRFGAVIPDKYKEAR